MDKLDKFIIEHERDFEEPRDPEAGWDRLMRKLDRRDRAIDTMIYWKVAAVIFFICTITLTVLNFSADIKNPPKGQMAYQGESLESFYFDQVSIKKKEYLSIANKTQSDELLGDLDKMDEAYQELKRSFVEIESEEMANAILENLRLRVLILNEQIEIIRNGEDKEESFHSS